MNAIENKMEVGTTMIYVSEYGAMPVETAVIRVTPGGQINVAAQPRTRFKNDYGNFKAVGDRYNKSEVCNYSEEKMANLVQRHEDVVKNRKEKQEAEEARNVARNVARSERAAKELAELKEVMPFLVTDSIKQDLPDGTRLYTIQMPVKAEYLERKKFEIAIIRVKDIEVSNFRTEPTKYVEAHMTYCNANGNSFPSCSGIQHDNDEAVLWECASYLFHRGW